MTWDESGQWDGAVQPGYYANIEWEIVGLLAGGFAEVMYCGHPRVMYAAKTYSCGTRNLEKVDASLIELSAMAKRRVLKPFIKRTIDFLEAHWAEVEALGRALAEAKRIEGDRITEIVDAAKQRADQDCMGKVMPPVELQFAIDVLDDHNNILQV